MTYQMDGILPRNHAKNVGRPTACDQCDEPRCVRRSLTLSSFVVKNSARVRHNNEQRNDVVAHPKQPIEYIYDNNPKINFHEKRKI